MHRERTAARIIASTVLFVFVFLLAIPAAGEAPPCKGPNKNDSGCDGGDGGDDGGGDGGGTETMTFDIDIDWTGILSDTGEFTTEVTCTNNYCEIFPDFLGGVMPTFNLPLEFLQHWTVEEADACFGATNPDGSVTRPVHEIFLRVGEDSFGTQTTGFKVHYQAWTKAGESEPVIYHILFRRESSCPGTDCAVFPPAAGGTTTFTDLELIANSYLSDLDGKQRKGKGAERCWCTPDTCGAIPGLDSVAVTRLP